MVGFVKGKGWMAWDAFIMRRRLFFEQTYPYLFGLLAGFFWWKASISFPSNDSIISSTLSVAGIFVGFLATSKAILISMNSPVINELKRSGYINELVSYIGQAIWLNLAVCTLDVIAYFANQTKVWFGVTWVFLSVASLMAFIRVTHIMLKIFKYS
jgi:hypothetical protein